MAIEFCDYGGWRTGEVDTIYAALQMAAFFAAPKAAATVARAVAGAG
jgi:hypothetical protein